MSEDDDKVFTPKSLPDHERPLGRLMAETSGEPYLPLRTLAEAQAAPDGVVILQGDDGGQIYVVCRASSVACDPAVLADLLRDLDEIAWPGNDPSMARVYFERRPVGAGVAGGKGGGQVTDEPWIHKEFVQLHLADAIMEVLRGSRRRIR